MESASSSSSVSAPQETSHRDELFMQQGLLFSNSLKDLKNLRKQLYSAAEYFEVSYSKERQKHIVVETLKDYATKAFINTVDHLGSVAFKVNTLLDEKTIEASGAEFRLSCMEQRLQTCREFIDREGLFQQTLVLNFPKYHKRYNFPDGLIMDGYNSRPMHQFRTYCRDEKFCHDEKFHHVINDITPLISVIDDREIRGTPSPRVRKGFSPLPSPQSFYRPGTFQFTKISSKSIRTPEKQTDSPNRFPFIRSGSVLMRSLSPISSNTKQRYPSEPRRSASMPIHTERDKKKELEQYANKSKRVFKALLSIGKSKNDGKLYKYLDEH